MSRYYRLVVTPVSIDGKKGPATTWTNKSGNHAILGAQRVEFDIMAGPGATPAGGAWIRIWGPTREQVQQASDFNGAELEFYGGMQNGLPLATHAVAAGQTGLLLKGTVFQSFANWQGIVQTLEFVVYPSPGDISINTDAGRQAAATGAPPPPQNFTFAWKQGASLTASVQNVLTTAYPGASVTISAADGLILLHDEAGAFTDLRTFATYIQGLSRDIKGPTYAGLNITPNGSNSFLMFDNTKSSGKVTGVTMLDLIGQVTWLSAATATFTTVLRADFNIGDTVKFPPLAGAQAVTTANSESQARTKNTFNGNWMINDYVRHVGDSRGPDAGSWVSVFQAVPMTGIF